MTSWLTGWIPQQQKNLSSTIYSHHIFTSPWARCFFRRSLWSWKILAATCRRMEAILWWKVLRPGVSVSISRWGKEMCESFVMELFEIGFKWKVCSKIVNVVRVKVVYVWYGCDYAVLNVEDRPRLHTLVISPCSLFHLQTLTLNPILCICLAICRLCIYKHINM